MLEPQLGGRRFQAEYTSKFGADLPGFNAGFEAKGKPPDDGMVKRLLDLVDKMKRKKLVTPLSSVKTLETLKFYADQSAWYNGLYAFSAPLGLGDDAVRVISYLLWKPWNDSILFLAGSPQFVLGEKKIRESVQIYQTTGTWSSILNFADSILRTDNPNFVGSTDRDFSTEDALAMEVPWVKWGASPLSRNEDVLPVELAAGSQALASGMLCVRYLTRLPRENMDLIFQVFRSLPFVRRTDLPRWANELMSFPGIDPQLKQLLWRCKTVYMGSPLYTAFGE